MSIGRGAGPFRTSISDYSPTNYKFSTWAPRDTMSWWQDGSSNQFIFGEKLFTPNASYTTPEAFTQAFSEFHIRGGHITTYMCANPDIYVQGIVRTFFGNRTDAGTMGYIPSGRNDTTNQAAHGGGNVYFGSFHSGIINVLLGDGSVRALSVSTKPSIATYLSHVSDDNSVSL